MKNGIQLSYAIVAVIDCYWFRFGGIQDRFDLIAPPAFIVIIASSEKTSLSIVICKGAGPSGYMLISVL
jgi:hypothetical protein